MKNWKTFWKAQTVSCLKKIIQPPPTLHTTRWNLTTPLKQKYSNQDIQKYTDICFRKVVLGCQEMVQCKCFFRDQTEICLLKNFQSEKVFWLCFGSILFSISKESRFLKWVRFFQRNDTVNWVIFYANFYWPWDFLLENLEWKKSGDVHWKVWTKVLCPQYYF